MTATTFIYVLKDPDTGQVRYVGKADDPYRRFKQHVGYFSKTHRTCWIRKLKSLGKLPILEILDEISIEHWQQWEVAWIEYFKEQGCDLVNGTLGGEGLLATPETKQKISQALKGIVRSPETRLKISRAHKGRPSSRKGIKTGKPSWNRGPLGPRLSSRRQARLALTGSLEYTPTKETRLKLSQAKKGKPLSEDHRRKVSLAKMGEKNPMFGKTFSPEHIEKKSIAMRGSKNHNFQRVYSAETLARMSAGQKRRFERERCEKTVKESLL